MQNLPGLAQQPRAGQPLWEWRQVDVGFRGRGLTGFDKMVGQLGGHSPQDRLRRRLDLSQGGKVVEGGCWRLLRQDPSTPPVPPWTTRAQDRQPSAPVDRSARTVFQRVQRGSNCSRVSAAWVI